MIILDQSALWLFLNMKRIRRNSTTTQNWWYPEESKLSKNMNFVVRPNCYWTKLDPFEKKEKKILGRAFKEMKENITNQEKKRRKTFKHTNLS